MELKNLNQESKYKIFAIASLVPILIFSIINFSIIYIILLLLIIVSIALEKKTLVVVGYYLFAASWFISFICDINFVVFLIFIAHACFATLLLKKKEKDKLFIIPLCLFGLGILVGVIDYLNWTSLVLLFEIVNGFFVMKIFCNPNKEIKNAKNDNSKLNSLDALIKVKDLYDKGILTEEEYNAERAKLLN